MSDQRRVLLIRHGETHGYFGDVGLTEVGEEQARAKGIELAATLAAGDVVRMRCAPTARGSATAEVLYRALESARPDGVDLTGPEVDARIDSMQFLLGDAAVESTNAAAARQQRPAEDRRPDWVAEFDRFDVDMGATSRAGGPIDRWLVSANRYFEPPQVATYRLWAAVTAFARDLPAGGIGYAVGHSGPMRAFAAVAFGSDQGEPANLQHVAVTLTPGEPTAEVEYAGRSVLVDVPDRLPPWLDPAYLDGNRKAPTFD